MKNVSLFSHRHLVDVLGPCCTILIDLIELKLKLYKAIENDSVNLEILFQTMFC